MMSRLASVPKISTYRDIEGQLGFIKRAGWDEMLQVREVRAVEPHSPSLKHERR